MAKLLVEERGFRAPVSWTTRKPRKGEVDGQDYHFRTTAEFLKLKKEGGFAEWAEVHGYFYGTPSDELESSQELGDTVLDIDCQGAMNLKRMYSDAVLIFVVPPSKIELRRRLESRGTDSPAVIDRRMKNALGEISQVPKFDAFILNVDLVRAEAELLDLIEDMRTNGRISLFKYHNPLKAQMIISAWRS